MESSILNAYTSESFIGSSSNKERPPLIQTSSGYVCPSDLFHPGNALDDLEIYNGLTDSIVSWSIAIVCWVEEMCGVAGDNKNMSDLPQSDITMRALLSADTTKYSSVWHVAETATLCTTHMLTLLGAKASRVFLI